MLVNLKVTGGLSVTLDGSVHMALIVDSLVSLPHLLPLISQIAPLNVTSWSVSTGMTLRPGALLPSSVFLWFRPTNTSSDQQPVVFRTTGNRKHRLEPERHVTTGLSHRRRTRSVTTATVSIVGNKALCVRYVIILLWIAGIKVEQCDGMTHT